MSIISTIKKTIAGDEKPKRTTAKAKNAPEKKKASVAEAPSKTGSFAPSFASALITHPYLTEKTSFLQATNNAYVFKVARSATANEVKKAVQKLFSVTVEKVNMTNMPSKKVRHGMREGRVPGFRKAIVRLKKGDKIDIGA